MSVLWRIPGVGTTVFQGPELREFFDATRKCEFSFHIEGEEPYTLTRISLVLEDVQAFKCTYEEAVTSEMVATSYHQLVSVDPSPWLDEVMEVYRDGKAAAEGLKHFRIFFDEGACYEWICRAFVQSQSTEPLA